MVTPQTLDWSQTGVLDIQDGSGNSLDVIHLRSVTYVGQANASFSSDATNPDDISCVAVTVLGRGVFNLDIRNITSPSYASTQALINAFKTNIAAMYAGGGGGGGVTSVNGDTGPAVVLPLAGIKYNWSTATSGSPASGVARADSNTIGSITELVFNFTDADGGDQLGVFLSIAGTNQSPTAAIGYGTIEISGVCFQIKGAAVVGGEVTIPVAYQDSTGTLPANGEPVGVSIFSQDRVATQARVNVDGSEINAALFVFTGTTDGFGRLDVDLAPYGVASIVHVSASLTSGGPAMVFAGTTSATAVRGAFADDTGTAVAGASASIFVLAQF